MGTMGDWIRDAKVKNLKKLWSSILNFSSHPHLRCVAKNLFTTAGLVIIALGSN